VALIFRKDMRRELSEGTDRERSTKQGRQARSRRGRRVRNCHDAA
jgi:hypothetical protein